MSESDLVVARAAVVAAAREWYSARGNTEAPLAAAVQRLEELERRMAEAQKRDHVCGHGRCIPGCPYDND